MLLEAFVIEKLSGIMDVPVYAEVPADYPPGAFCVIERTGSWKQNHVPGATIAIQSYGASLLEAAQLNEDVKAAMETVSEENEIGSIRLNSDYNFTDYTTRRYRYQAVFDITYYD